MYFEKCQIEPLESGTHLMGEHKSTVHFNSVHWGFIGCVWTIQGEPISQTERGKKGGNRKRTLQMNSERGNKALGNLNGLTLGSSGIGTEDMLQIWPSNHQKQEIALISKLKDHNFPRKQ